MTQHIGIAHRGASGSEPLSRRAALESKHQDEGLGVRALAVLFIGFAVYLKTFFTASQAEDTAAQQDPNQTGVAEQTETAAAADAVAPGLLQPVAKADDAQSIADVPQIAPETSGDLPILVALALPLTPAGQEQITALDTSGASSILSDPVMSDTAGIVPGDTQQAGTPAAIPGPGRVTAGEPAQVANAVQTTQELPDAGTGSTTPAAPQVYDIAALFQDMGVTLHDRPDGTVDRVTDLAIGDLMRDLTLEEFRAQLGQIPPAPGRPLDRVITILNDEGSREAFLARTGLIQDPTLDASYRPDEIDPLHSHYGTEPDTGPDLFL